VTADNYRPAPAAEVLFRRRVTHDTPLDVARSRMGVRVFIAGTRLELRRDIALKLAHDIADALSEGTKP